MINNSLITLNENAVENNIAFLKKKLGDKVKISAVVKANAYGHGIEQIVPLFEKYGIDHYSVFYYSEAIRVFDSLSKPATIMVMGWLCEESVRGAIARGIEFFVFNIERLNFAIKYAKELNSKAKIHIEAETGMNRSGLNADELKNAITKIKENADCIEIVGFCTHLAGAESISNHVRIQSQLKKYNKMLVTLGANGLIPKYRHVANSAAAFVYPKARMDLVRIGIMLYGFWSSSEVYVQYINHKNNKINPLKRILGWNSQIMAIKKVKSGEFIGYGISYLAQTDIITALVPIGYSFGYSRSLSNKGRVLIGGQRCSVIGVVNMNMIIVDISHVDNAKVGDEVVLIGKQNDLEIKVSAFSEISNELNYEILAHLSESIVRTVIKQ
ncbi:alanine racemase [Ancylomarina euxinus]|uniref:Alanine racemase n=1 Tax=Ancylomarina euxinus TaxID=2283627 RepID=A0A425Y2W8_9BACT|nr:alanine racemase [Ancylomarina euxinus]MCZ4693204.1 alanine racemase [Ancylomarina euxinus]MUP15340.1 alanine racemase [Ancylomarina euxinus]RRG22533.1 alanine racemase [Ancylomarina euxinus]